MSLSCLKDSNFVFDDNLNNDLSIVHFRLTDSALKDLEQLALKLGDNSFKISFDGTEGSFIIPLDKPSKFTFNSSNVTGSHDDTTSYLKIKKGSTFCIGKATSRITVNAKEDTFSLAREKLTQLEEENRKSHTRELSTSTYTPQKRINGIKKNINTPNQKSDTLRPLPNLANNSQHSVESSIRPSNVNGSGPSPPTPNHAVSLRPLRERIIHLLALRPYQRPELLLRLTRDGLSRVQKDQIPSVLTTVGRPGRQSAYQLMSSVIPELDPQWPGYTDAERKRVISLKANHQLHKSPSKSPNRSQTSSPALSNQLSDDQFTRRPTRTNAPAAPHALAKKIAALDMLHSGVSDVEVAARLGVYRGLLNQWRATESDIRERYRRHNAAAFPNSSGLNCNGQNGDFKSVDKYSPLCVNDNSFHSTYNQDNTVIKHTHHSPSHALSTVTTLNGDQQRDDVFESNVLSSTDRNTSSRLERTNFSDYQRSERVSTRSTVVSPTSIQENLHNLDSYGRQNPGAITGGVGGGGGGSEGESAEHTPFSNSSVGSSGYCGSNTASCGIPNSTLNGRRGVGATNQQDDSYTQSEIVENSLPTTLEHCPNVDNNNKDQQEELILWNSNTNPMLGLQHDSRISTDLTYKLTEIDRLYPKISSPHQLSLYLAEFESTYPTYLRMYHSFADVWQTVSNLRSRLLEATKSEGFDSAITTHFANQLDSFMRRARTPKYSDDEAQLTLMAHKLRLLKQRLADYKQSSSLSSSISATTVASGQKYGNLKRRSINNDQMLYHNDCNSDTVTKSSRLSK